MILTLTGPSGVGKTTIAGKILESTPGAKMFLSYTTRAARLSDLPGEYAYTNQAEFDRLVSVGAFAWSVGEHGKNYGTAHIDFAKAAEDNQGVHIMLIVPQTIPRLHRHAVGLGISVMSLYITCRDNNTLRQRLLGRGEELKAIESRIRDCESWDTIACRQGAYTLVDNSGTIGDTMKNVLPMIEFVRTCVS